MDTSALADTWLDMWNGETAVTPDILTDDFRIHLGAPISPDVADGVHGPAGMAAFVDRYCDTHPGTVFRRIGPVSGDAPEIAFVWTASTPDGALTGIDYLVVRDGRIAEVWSVTGARELPGVE